jgi:ComF family protein
MIDELLQIVAPHHCYGCLKTGSVLCTDCKYNIVSEPFSGCIVCQKPTGASGVCSGCKTSFGRAWCVTARVDTIEQLLNGYKFEREKSSYKILADILNEHLPDLSHQDIVVVPIPTVSQHVRRRGYDHTRLIAQRFARLRNKKITTRLLRRKNAATQLGASRKNRIAQAKIAFTVEGGVSREKIYLLIDDIATTGSTLEYAARALKEAGALHVWVAVIARQPLDK